MSKESDARDCLIEAVERATGIRLEREQLSVLTPSDVGYGTGQAWLDSLRRAADCLRDKGHTVGTPTRPKAEDLLSKVLNASVLYLKNLITAAAKA